jgi:hypothetical protein
MKKIYTLSLVVFAFATSFAQTFYSENFGTPTATTLFPAYTTGTAPATFQNASPILYTGSADVRLTGASTGYVGASGSGNAFIGTATAIGKFMQIDGLNTSAYNTADMVLSFGYLTANAPATNQVIVEQSTDGTTFTPIVFTPNPASTWTLVTTSGILSSTTLSLRFTNPGGTAQIRIDDIALSNGATPPPLCTLLFGSATTLCDAITAGVDTYTTTIPFTGGGTATYTIVSSVGTVGGDSPSTSVTGNITISGVNEGTAIAFTTTSTDCNLTVNVTSPSCSPPPVGVTLPYYNPFNYTVGAALGTQPNWVNVNTGDDVVTTAGNLSYAGIPEVGNSISFGGVGIDNTLPITENTTGTVYYSFLINATDVAAATNTAGGYLGGFAETVSGTTYGATLWTKQVDATTYNFGIETRTSTGVNTTFTTDAYTAGDTHLIVVSYTFVDGALNDIVNLYVDPTVGGAQPAATITDTGSLLVDLAKIGAFFFRQDSVGETPSVQIDALRIGTTWDDVTGTNLSVKNNTIAGLKVYPNPITNGKLFIETSANAEKAVVIFDVLGKQVLSATTFSNEVNVSKLNAGVYVVKITENGSSSSRKLVIR